MPTPVRSYSKINLGLALGSVRVDGFHGLTTLYQTLEAHDLVTVAARPAAATRITITGDDGRVPSDSRNTAWKSVELTLAALGVAAEVAIHIEKRLPIQGGMGAGSANAVAAAVGLSVELAKHGIEPLSGAKRLEIAALVGSDVPLFLVGGTVLGLGRGEEVYPMPDLPAMHCVVALPEIGVSTPQAFRDWDERQGTGLRAQSTEHRKDEGEIAAARSSGLTLGAASDRLVELSRTFAVALCEPHSSGVFALGGGLAGNPLSALVRTGIENDFEEVVFPAYPLLGQIKRLLAVPEIPEMSALYASLSGSGSAVFGLYGTLEAAEAAVVRVRALGVRSLLTKTLPRLEYWRGMLVE